jgi:hypothetical protein
MTFTHFSAFQLITELHFVFGTFNGMPTTRGVVINRSGKKKVFFLYQINVKMKWGWNSSWQEEERRKYRRPSSSHPSHESLFRKFFYFFGKKTVKNFTEREMNKKTFFYINPYQIVWQLTVSIFLLCWMCTCCYIPTILLSWRRIVHDFLLLFHLFLFIYI